MTTREEIRFNYNFWAGVYRAVRNRGNGRLSSFYWTLALWYRNI